MFTNPKLSNLKGRKFQKPIKAILAPHNPANFTKPIYETVLQFLNSFFRWSELFNGYENEDLTDEFHARLKQLKKRNARILYDTYYYPLAVEAILEEENYLATDYTAESRAIAMMTADIADGVLDEFNRFKEIEE